MDQDLSKDTTIPCLEASQTVDPINLDGLRTYHELTEINGNENVKQLWREKFPLPNPSASPFFSQHLCDKDIDQQLIEQEVVKEQITDKDGKKLLSCPYIKNNVNSEHGVTDFAIDANKTTEKGFKYVQIYADETIIHTQDNQSAPAISEILQKPAVPITAADGFNKSVTVDSVATDPLLVIAGNHNKPSLLKEESEDNISGNQSSQFNPSSINFSESDTDAEVESAKVLFYVLKDRDDISTLHEVESLQTETEDTVENKPGKSYSSDDILVTHPESNCESNNFIHYDDLDVNYDSSVAGFTGTNDHFQSESLDVNFDSGSAESLTDLEDDHICSQYSNAYSIDDVEPKPNYSEVPDEQSIVRESRSDRSGLNIYDLNEPGIDKAEFKIQRNINAQSLAKDSTVSDISAFESFYSLDACSTPVVRRLKKTLTWTPRILSEERFLSSRSTTLSSDVTSFYTAETSGTFFSARSFQLDSCDNFATCEDFQALELRIEPKSKLRRAKDALVRGREFFRSKFECYIKKLPHSPRHSDKKSKKLCHNSCGFSCIHVGKEISMYSLPDLQAESKGGNKNEIELKGENCDGMDIEGDNLNTHKENKQKSGGLPQKKLVHNEGMNSGEKNNGHSESLVNRKRGDLIVDDHDVWIEDNELEQKGEKQDRNVKKHKSKNDRKQRMPTLSRGTTEDTEDDLPVGTEANTVSQGRSTRESYDSDESRSKKRLRWVSAVEKSQGNSLTSAHTSTSSVDQLLFQREMDPELLLSSLGFGGTVQTDDDTLSRIPDRFLPSAHSAQNVDVYQPVMNPPEIHHLLPVMGTSQLMQGISHSMHCGQGGHSPGVQCTSPVSPEDSPVFADDNVDGIDFRAGNQNKSSTKEKGSMQRPSFSALAHGKMFLDRTQAQLHQPQPSPEEDEETRKLCEIPSILDFPNRRALARQGFYGKIYNSTANQPPESKLKRTVSASEKRKQFHSGKTKINWSLTDESEEGSSSGQADRTVSVDSWDRGLILKSFSDRFSSDSSFESNDSFGERLNEHQLVKQNSISNLREQYNQTIMKSMDRDVPVFTDEDSNSQAILGNKRKVSLGDIRKQQVNRLMTSLDDDGDYFAHSLQSSMKENSLRPTLAAAQKFTQSTLTDSPVSPNDRNFSFDKGLNDGEGEFDFKNEKSEKLIKQNKQSVSIIVEEDVESVKSFDSRETTHRDGNELAPFQLTVRSDSCNTLVPQDSNFEGDGVEGELTPRPGGLSPGLSPSPNNFEINLLSGDALSESTGSSTTLSTVIHDQLDADILEQGERSRSLEENTESRSMDDNNMLKPKPCPAQESFELEEISSAEDWNGNVTKSFVKKGTLEKSASTHSDSSGFADLDTVGETTLSNNETGKDQSSLLHSKFRSAKPSAQQQGNPAFRLAENSDMVRKKNLMNLTAVNVSKNSSSDLDKENNDPRLQSIHFFPIEKASEKSLVYTVNVPLSPVIENDTPKCSERFRYVSTLSVKFGDSSEEGSHKQSSIPKVMEVGPLTFKRVRSVDDVDLDPEEIERDASRSDNGVFYTSDAWKSQNHSADSKEIVNADNNFPDGRTFNRLNHSENGKKSLRDKEKVLEKKLAKDALISAKSHTADWLLRQYGSQNISQTISRSDGGVNLQFKLGRPAWASTPNLKAKRNLKKDDMGRSRRIMPQSQSSFDLLLDETSACSEQTTETDIYRNQQNFSRSMEHFDQAHIDKSDLKHDLDELESRQRLAELQGDSNFSSLDESVDVSRPSLIGSSTGLPEDQINYIRLARLVNGPSLIADISKMPNSRFTPNFHMKNWTHLPKRKHLEEETLLMQHAVQRYKTELCLMENMLFALYRTAQEDLAPEDRSEVEELQQLWVEVRKEVIKMEELLSQRLKSIMQGNDYYNPLDALEIVQSMIDLLREQLYHQQMCIGRDLDLTNDDLDPSVTAASTRSSVSGSWMNDISSQVSELKSSIASAEQQQKQELQERIAELKTSLLSEVKSEIYDTQNTKMLQLQLQAREAEIRRLKMELLLQNVGTGRTRKIQTLESDV